MSLVKMTAWSRGYNARTYGGMLVTDNPYHPAVACLHESWQAGFEDGIDGHTPCPRSSRTEKTGIGRTDLVAGDCMGDISAGGAASGEERRIIEGVALRA